MGILFGLATALCWGSADLYARFSTRQIGTWRTMLYMQLTGFLLLTAALPWLGGFGHLADGSGWTPWAWGIFVGLINALGTLSLYRSFEIGKLSIVAPISAAYPALTMLLSAMTGERLTFARKAGFFLILLGVIIVARGESVPDATACAAPNPPLSNSHRGVAWAFLAGTAFGVMFWLLGLRVVPLVGSAQTVWLIRLTSLLLTAAIMLTLRQPLVFPRHLTKRWILAVGVLDTSAYVFNNFGMLREQLSVVSVLGSLYGAVTVALAATVLGEKISRLQWAGVVSIFTGIIFISR